MVRTGEQIFVSRLARLPVRDPAGELVGRVADAVVTAGRVTPRLLGLVVRVQRRPIFLNAGRIADLNASGVRLTSGAVNLRRFEAREAETLVLGALLDRSGTLADGQRVLVNDVAIARGATGWEVASLDVVLRDVRGRPRRRVEWAEVSGLEIGGEKAGAERTLARLAELKPTDVATILQDMPSVERRELAAMLDDERLADILEELPEDVQADIIRAMPGTRAADVLEEMETDDAADLLAEMPATAASELLELMDPEDAEPLRRLLRYAGESAGGLMTTEPIILPPTATVAEALALLRDPDFPSALAAQVFIARPPTETPTGRYIGTAYVQRLLREPPGTALGSCTDDNDPDPLGPSASTREVA